MTNKSYYHRSFIILKPLTEGFGLEPSKEAGGYCKFEIRKGIGKAYIYAQNLKPGSLMDGTYETYLISMDDAIEPYRLGRLHIDDNGRGEYVASFNSKDLKGTGYTLEHFHGLIIVFKSEAKGNRTGLAYPLVGYSERNLKMEPKHITEKLKKVYGNETYEVHGGFREAKETIDSLEGRREELVATEDVLGKKHELEMPGDHESKTDQDGAQDKSEISIDKDAGQEIKTAPDEMKVHVDSGIDKNNIGQNNISQGPSQEGGGLEEIIEEEELTEENHKLQMEFNPLKVYPAPELPYMESGADDHVAQGSIGERDKSSQGDKLDKSGVLPTYWDGVKDYFEGLFRTGQKVEPFEYDLGEIRWVRVQQFMPRDYYARGTYNYTNNYPDHYIIGLREIGGKVENIIYGVPSMYSLIPSIPLSGYSRWVPMKEGQGLGYWLMYIDASNGMIVNAL